MATEIHCGPAIVVLGIEHDGKAQLAAALAPSLVDDGPTAAPVPARAPKAIGGGGGGTGALASAGGRTPAYLGDALDLAAEDAASLLRGR
ncbi:hypothetical protein [Streptomyces iconiensis]|uniref:Uncharacterized protein n=1 Tax=Streptomyces iconiensis TaxID=1384038 RepID=A0ABT7A260_9ACTN|nr:hypothetical protein [Streptomyces iconiensis]MDJ1135404.1 hypothetical protein [Streptomyces iconiensis]